MGEKAVSFLVILEQSIATMGADNNFKVVKIPRILICKSGAELELLITHLDKVQFSLADVRGIGENVSYDINEFMTKPTQEMELGV